jgi:N-hydroxyarylamine O-acetyltransferase
MLAMDLDAYFARIGYRGPATPTLETLTALHTLHPAAIPFENLDPLLGRPVRLDIATLEAKLVRARRGGYCYEQNLLLAEALRTLGFSVRGLGARVLYRVPEGTQRPRTHMLLRVDIGETPYIADVGFGGLTMTGPLRFETDVEQATPHETFRLQRSAAGDYLLQALVGGSWLTLFRFDESEHAHADFEMGSWYTSTHPQSIFVNGLMCARALPGERIALLNSDLTVYRTGRKPERLPLANAAEIRDALVTRLGIALPEDDKLDTTLPRLVLPRAG